jgi:hypothetical protein
MRLLSSLSTCEKSSERVSAEMLSPLSTGRWRVISTRSLRVRRS